MVADEDVDDVAGPLDEVETPRLQFFNR